MNEADELQRGPSAPLRILFVTSDKFPPFRPAAKAIFAEGLAAAGTGSIGCCRPRPRTIEHGDLPFKGGIAYVAPTNAGETRLARLKKHWFDIRNDLRVFGLLEDGAAIRSCRSRTNTSARSSRSRPRSCAACRCSIGSRTRTARRRCTRPSRASLATRWYALRGALQRFVLYRLIMPACAHVFVQSEQMRLDVANEGIPLEKMTAVPSSVNLDDMDAAATAAARTPPLGGKPIVYLGTLLRERQLDFLVRVLARVSRRARRAARVRRQRRDARGRELLRAEAERLGVSRRVTITGWLPMPAAWSAYAPRGGCACRRISRRRSCTRRRRRSSSSTWRSACRSSRTIIPSSPTWSRRAARASSAAGTRPSSRPPSCACCATRRRRQPWGAPGRRFVAAAPHALGDGGPRRNALSRSARGRSRCRRRADSRSAVWVRCATEHETTGSGSYDAASCASSCRPIGKP